MLDYNQRLKNFTPLVKRIPESGGAFYTFPSAAEDLTVSFSDMNEWKFRFSKYALLDIPKILNEPESNTIKLQAIPGAYNSVNYELTTDLNIHFIQSFQNYCLNLETHLLSRKEYDATNKKTVSERVFWKWIKELSGIRFQESNLTGLDSIRFEEENESADIYSKVVKLIGEVNLSGTQVSKSATFTEIYLNIPEDAGTTAKVLFKIDSDNNYKPGLVLSRLEDGVNNETIYGRKYDDIHPDGLDLRAIYDNDDGFVVNNSNTTKGLWRYKKTVNDGTPDNITQYQQDTWWYSVGSSADSYYLEDEFTNPSNDSLGIFYGQKSDVVSVDNLLRFKRSKLDGIGIDFDLKNYGTIYQTYHDMSTTVSSSDFEFNSILLYYDMYKTKVVDGIEVIDETSITTNLFGILFLDNVSRYSDAGGEIKSFYKQRFNEATQRNGNEYGFKLNFRIDTNTRTVDVLHIPVIAENNTIAMGMFLESLEKMIDISDSISANALRYGDVSGKVSTLEAKINNLYDPSAFYQKLSTLENMLVEQSDTSLFKNDVQNLQRTYLKTLNTLENLLKNKTSLQVLLDIDTVRAGDNIEIVSYDKYSVINSIDKSFNYCDNSSITFDMIMTKEGTGVNDRYYSLEVPLVQSNNYIRFYNEDMATINIDYDLKIYIKDFPVKWKKGQIFRINFKTPYNFKTTGSEKNLYIFTDYSNLMKNNTNYQKSIAKINSAKFQSKLGNLLIELHCVNPETLEFYVDIF